MKALPYLIRKEFLQIRRTRAMIAITIGMPIIQLLVLGYAVSSDVVHVPTAVVDLDRSATSRYLVSKFENTRYLDVEFRPTTAYEGHTLVMNGDVILSVTIPKDFEHKLTRGEQPELSLLADAQNSNVAVTGAAYVRRIILSWAQQRAASNVTIRSNIRPAVNTIDIKSRIWYNPELKSVFYMVPGIMVVLVTAITIMLTAMAIVREREMGTLEQLMVSPITRLELILGKTIPFAIIGLIELGISLLVIRGVYRIPINGSITVFLLMTVEFIFCTLGLGIFISTITTTQQQALFAAWFTIVFCMLMSGFLLPLENIPEVMRPLTVINPLRYYMSIVRVLFLKGAGFAELRSNIGALGIIAVVVLTASVVRFNKKMG